MKRYFTDPIEGVRNAFFVENSGATPDDFTAWMEEFPSPTKDPRAAWYGPANICEQVLDRIKHDQTIGIPHNQFVQIAFALGHFETLIRLNSKAIVGRSALAEIRMGLAKKFSRATSVTWMVLRRWMRAYVEVKMQKSWRAK